MSNLIQKMAEYSQDEISVHNRAEQEKISSTHVGEPQNYNFYDQGIGSILECAKKYNENGESPLLALIKIKGVDLKEGNISYGHYIAAWEAMERGGLL